jgi:hypothetical protein
MKKTKLLLLVLLTFAAGAKAQESKLIGSWLMTKAEVNGEIQNPYFMTDFNEDGKMVVMGMDAGTWEYNKSNHSIVMQSELDKDFNGEGKIENLTEDELVVEKDGARLFYRKIVQTEIEASNKNSGLMGTWEFKEVPYQHVNTWITFTEPDEFKIIQKEEGSEARLSGTWIFDKQNSSLIMIGLRGEDTFKGENKVQKIDAENLELENNGEVLKGSKKAQNSNKIERLGFTEGDFYNEDGDYKYYEEEEKLPWRNWDEMKMNLLNVKQLVYSYSKLINATETFETYTLTADVKAIIEEEGFVIDNIFNGYDRYNLPDDAEFQQNTDYSNPLYPLNEETFRVVGNEQITTPAGTFECAVIEVVTDSQILRKLWMITDRIGVYAKIIEDDPDESFGHYYVYELQEIK